MSEVYQLKITLRGSKPPIWRRITVASTMTLGDLHNVIQTAMGWSNSHLHDFYDETGQNYSMDMEDVFGDCSDGISENSVRLCELLTEEKQKLFYTYDFGDSWEHVVLLEKISDSKEKAPAPRCLKGKNACPPEDCGGIYGFYEMQEVLKDPDHPECEDIIEWLGGEFDPAEFDIAHVNALLANYK